VDLSDPDQEELSQVAEGYQLPLWVLTEPLDPKERPRVDQDGSTLLIVTRLSVREQQSGGPLIRTVPVGLIISLTLVVTVCREPGLVSAHLSRIFQRKRDWTRARLVFALFYAAGTGFINNIELLEEMAGAAEARLRRSPENEELLALLDIEKALIDTTVALKSNHALMDKFRQPEPRMGIFSPSANLSLSQGVAIKCSAEELSGQRLSSGNRLLSPPTSAFGLSLTREERDLLDDALTENQQAIFMAEIFGQVLASMSDAFGSIISNNLNTTMKFLAGVTIVLMLPTIIAGLYGMNVELPGAELKGAFLMLGGLCLGLMLAVSILFAKKKWF